MCKPEHLIRFFSISMKPEMGERSNNVWIYKIKPTRYCKEIIKEYKKRCPDNTEAEFYPTDSADYHQTATGRKIFDSISNVIYNDEDGLLTIVLDKPIEHECYLTITGRFRLNLSEIAKHQPLFGPPVEVNYGRHE